MVAIVSACSRFPWTVLALAILVTIAAGYYTATHFAINTNTNEFISARLPWRQNLIALDKAFPQRVDQIVVVIDGATPELAEAAAQSLTERLKRRPDLYQSVMRPEGGAYFDQNGLLFQPVADLQRTLNGLYQARPFLMALAYDPSLRGIVKAVSFIN
ncbi:MAG: hopanoid biosynthesis-associated RND transporter HpnN, partial [Methylocella sp.]